jgi:PEP-CTERM motif
VPPTRSFPVNLSPQQPIEVGRFNQKIEKMKFARPFATSFALLILTIAQPASADNLLANPGFETGDYSGWTVTGPFLAVQGVGHTGSFSSYCGAGLNDNGTTGDLLSQTFATTQGLNYDVSIWVIGNGGGASEAYISWDNVKVLDLYNMDFPSWTQLEITITADATTSTVGFGSRNDPSAFNFDDASVTLTPEPSVLALAGVALAGFVVFRRRK